MTMKRTCSFILTATTLLFTTLASIVSDKPLWPYAAATSQVDKTTSTTITATKFTTVPGFDSTKGNRRMANGYAEIGRGLSRLGSIPPRCEHKCRGCVPCYPIQIPTTTGGRLGVQYTNYEPEGWKCKCGTSYYNP